MNVHNDISGIFGNCSNEK